MDIDEIVDRYRQKLYKLCLFYLRSEEEAEEILHDIFIKVLKKQAAFKGKAAVYTWLYRIAVNTLLNHIKRKKIVEFISLERAPGSTGSADASAPGHHHDPALKLEQEQTRNLEIAKLEQCLQLLSYREKTAFYFFHYDNLKQKEIAEIMKISVSAVESLIHKGMKKIRKCVKSKQ